MLPHSTLSDSFRVKTVLGLNVEFGLGSGSYSGGGMHRSSPLLHIRAACLQNAAHCVYFVTGSQVCAETRVPPSSLIESYLIQANMAAQ